MKYLLSRNHTTVLLILVARRFMGYNLWRSNRHFTNRHVCRNRCTRIRVLITRYIILVRKIGLEVLLLCNDMEERYLLQFGIVRGQVVSYWFRQFVCMEDLG
jgi:hypothetical protein